MKRGVAILALGAALMGLGACEMIGEEPKGAVGEEICASTSTRNAIQEAMFDGAVARFDGEPLAINDMRRNARSKLDFVVLDGTDESIGRTNCSARLTVTVPVNVQEKFGGEDELLADITYFAQNAADGSGRVVEVEGLDFAISKIADAFAGKLAQEKPEAPEPKPTPKQEKAVTYNPSFRCDGRLNRVERIICTDPILSELDRQLARYYDRAVSEPGHSGNWDSIKDDQNEWRKGRDNCTTRECVERVYRERVEFLRISY